MENLIYPGSLHGHSDYSNLRLRDCIIKLEEGIEYAGELGHEVIAITDHESISGWVKAEKAAKKIKEKYPNLKVILGNEIYLCRNGLNADNFNKDNDKYYHFILLARDQIGAQQIREISTRAWMRSYMARGMRRVPTYYNDLFEIIGKNPGHVIGSTACLGGALPTQILRGTEDIKLCAWIAQMNDLFGQGNFYFEMQPSKNKDQITVNKKLLQFSYQFNIPFIITTDSHYLKKEDRTIHKAYLNAQNGDREVDDFYATTYMMNTEELLSFFPYLNELEIKSAFDSIRKIRDSIEDFSLLRPLKIPSLHWDAAEPLKHDRQYWTDKIKWLDTFYKSDFEGDHLMCDLIINKLEADERLQTERCYLEIEDNLERTWKSSVANKTHWSAYFLNLRDNIKECWNAGTLVGPARGSGGGFLLLYLLDIIQINPLWEEVKVYPWRFLNPDRVSPLD